MLAIRSSIYLTYTSQSIQFSTLTGSTLIVQSTLTASAITINATSTNTVTFSTLTGSTINAASLTATTIAYSTLTCSTANISTILPSTTGIGNTFLITSNGTTGTNGTTPQYQLDVTGTARAAVLQFQDDSVSITKQTPLDYSTFGQLWTRSIAPNAAWSSLAMSANGQIQVAVVNGGGIWYSSSYGAKWLQSATAGTSALAWSSVAVSANGTFVSAAVNGGGIWYSSNSGQTWTSAATSLAWSSVAVSASGQYQVACVNGASIWYSLNYGQTWTTANTSSLAWSSITISASGQYACATVNGGSIWYSSNYGLTWISSGVASSAWSAITMSASGQNVSATVNGGSIWYSTTYGQTWTSSGVASSAWNRICMVSSGQYQLASFNTQIYSSSNYGASWTPISAQFGPAAIAVSSTGQYSSMCVNTGAIYTSITAGPSLATSGALTVTEPLTTASLTYVDGSTDVTGQPPLDYTTFGLNWTNSGAGTLQWNGCAISATGQYMTASANASGVWYSSNYGQTWTQVSTATIPAASNVASIAISTSGRYQVAAATMSSYGIYYSSTYGQTWTQASGTTSITWAQICISGSGQYASACPLASNYIYYSSNYGQTWTSSTSSIQGVYGGIACSASGSFQVAAITSGGIYYSTNYGVTWTLSNVSSSGTVGYAGMSASGQYAIFPSSSAGMYVSTTYGQSWILITAVISSLPLSRACMSASGQYQLVSSNSLTATGGICYSTNYGQTWATFPMTNANGWTATAISANGQYALIGAFSSSLYMSVTRYPTVYATNAIVSFPSSYFTAATSGFTTLPGGMIAQWGFYTIPSQGGLYAGPYTVTFPKAFPSAVISVNVTLSDVGVGGGVAQYAPLAYGPVTTGFDLYTKSIPNALFLSSSAVTVYWHAYGY